MIIRKRLFGFNAKSSYDSECCQLRSHTMTSYIIILNTPFCQEVLRTFFVISPKKLIFFRNVHEKFAKLRPLRRSRDMPSALYILRIRYAPRDIFRCSGMLRLISAERKFSYKNTFRLRNISYRLSRYIVCQHIVPKAYHAPSADGATPLSRYTLTKSQNNAII